MESTAEAQADHPVERAITKKLEQALQPVHLAVENESYMHSVPAGSESHFKVVVISEAFVGQGAVARHRTVHGLLAEELAGGVHALSIEARTPSEWDASGHATTASPKCLGGSKADQAGSE